jgi:stage V sporulation protein B
MEWKQTVWVPVASALVMGVVALVLYEGLNRGLQLVTGARVSNAVAVLVSIVVAAVVYFVSMIKIGGYTAEMLQAFPKGNLLVRFARKLHLIQ